MTITSKVGLYLDRVLLTTCRDGHWRRRDGNTLIKRPMELPASTLTRISTRFIPLPCFPHLSRYHSFAHPPTLPRNAHSPSTPLSLSPAFAQHFPAATTLYHLASLQ
jgi:hypothetical protein